MPFRPTPYQVAAATVSLIAVGLVAAAMLASSARAHQSTEGGPEAWKAMCGPQETAALGCVMRSGKYLAFCIPRGQALRPAGDVENPAETPPVAYMRYRFGRPDAVELTYPARIENSARRFRYARELYARGAATVIAFDRGSHAYRYRSRLIARGQGEGHSVVHGIGVWRGGERLSFLRCADHNP